MAKLIKDYLSAFLSQETWQKTLLREWPDIVGMIAEYVLLESIQGSLLILVTESASWMQEMHCLRPVIIAKINTYLGKSCVTDFKLKNKTWLKKKYIPLQNSFAINNNLIKQVILTLSKTEQELLNRIQDKELQEVLKHFRFRCIDQDQGKMSL